MTTTTYKTLEEALEAFGNKWKNIECSAHDRTSSAACICDSLEDINSDYGYDDIKIFLSSVWHSSHDIGFCAGVEAAIGVVPKNEVFNLREDNVQYSLGQTNGYYICRVATIKALKELKYSWLSRG